MQPSNCSEGPRTADFRKVTFHPLGRPTEESGLYGTAPLSLDYSGQNIGPSVIPILWGGVVRSCVHQCMAK